jgi:hypothetical protein
LVVFVITVAVVSVGELVDCVVVVGVTIVELVSVGVTSEVPVTTGVVALVSVAASAAVVDPVSCAVVECSLCSPPPQATANVRRRAARTLRMNL